jgi:hypothetical protein
MQLNYGFDEPDAAVLYGAHLFVANKANSSVTEVNAANGNYQGTLRAATFGFRSPIALAVLAPDLFVANEHSVTQVSAATHALVRTFSSQELGMTSPVALATTSPHYLFVLGTGGAAGAGAVVEVNTSTGQVLRRASGARFGFAKPSAVAAAGGHVFVAESASNSVSELTFASLGLMRVLSSAAGSGAFDAPAAMVAHGGYVWVTNQANHTVTQLSAATGGIVQVVPNTSNYLPSPVAITWGDGYVFVASPPGSSPMITQVVPSNPAKLPWMMCNTNGPYTFSNPQALVVYGNLLWVVNEGGAGGPPGDSLTEMLASSGRLVKVVR